MTDETRIPPLGFGTYGRTGPEGIAALLHALELGYRHLDTAQSYNTEAECGEALRRSGLARDDVFLTTKITGANATSGRLVASLEESCRTLGVDAVDLTLLHWPVGPDGPFDLALCLGQLAEAQERGLTRLIGGSNFTIAHLEEAARILGPGRIANNQFERHPHLQNRRLVDYCVAHGIAVTCYLPLARGATAGDPVIEAIAARHGATAHQIALAFSLNEGLIVIPTSGRRERIAENWAARDIRLTPEEMAEIRAADRAARQIAPAWGPAWD